MSAPGAVLTARVAGCSVIACKRDKKPALPKWKEWQKRQPDPEQLETWSRMSNVASWAIVTGAISGRVVLDFDGPEGLKLSERCKLEPQGRSGNGGGHLHIAHPGWYVPTWNSKSKQEMGKRWPGLDVKGDGGYAIFHGHNENGEYRYPPLDEIELASPDVLPVDLRRDVGLLEPTVTAQTLLHRYLAEAVAPQGGNSGSRNSVGFELACQLRDNRIDRAQATETMREYVRRCPVGDYPHRGVDALASLEQAYGRSPREPWAVPPPSIEEEEPVEEQPAEPAATFAQPLEEFIADEREAPEPLLGTADDCILPALGLGLLIAKGGKGKTTFSIEVALHLASGVDYLRLEVGRPLNVLFIENEGPREPFRRKLERKAESWPHEIKGKVYVYDENWGHARLDLEGFTERLNAFCEREAIDLVMGDPLDSLGMDGEGSPSETRAMVDRFKVAGLFTERAWWLPHHSRKESVQDAVDEASGAWGGRPDAMLALEKKKDNQAKLTFAKVRWEARERQPYLLDFEPETESFSFVKEEAGEERDYGAEIEEFLTENPYKTSREIATAIQASKDNVEDVLKAQPTRFRERTGDAAKAVGRSPLAHLWELASAFEPVEPVSDFQPELG